MRSAVKDFYERFLHSRELLPMLLSGLPRAGVFDGLDSFEESPPTHPPDGAVGFLVAGNEVQGSGIREQGTENCCSGREKGNGGSDSDGSQ
jgi:hypothetical protein